MWYRHTRTFRNYWPLRRTGNVSAILKALISSTGSDMKNTHFQCLCLVSSTFVVCSAWIRSIKSDIYALRGIQTSVHLIFIQTAIILCYYSVKIKLRLFQIVAVILTFTLGGHEQIIIESAQHVLLCKLTGIIHYPSLKCIHFSANLVLLKQSRYVCSIRAWL